MKNIVAISVLATMAPLFCWNHQVYSQEQLQTATELEKQGKIDQAVEIYLDFYDKNPQRLEILQSIAELYNRNKRYNEAIEYMEKLIVKDADFLFRGAHFKDQCDRLLRAWDSIGKGNIIKAGGIELATKHYKAKINDEDTTSRMKAVSQIILGDIAEKAKDSEKQREHYYKAYEQVISASDDWEKAVNRVLQRKFMDKAWFNDAVTVYTNYPDYSNLIQLGQWLKRQGRGYEMIDLYKDYLLRGNPEKEKYYSIGGYEPYTLSVNVIDELVSVRRGESLIGQFNELIAADPKNPELHRRFGYMLIKMRRNEEALREIEKYLVSKEQASASDYEWAGDLCEQAKLSDIAIQYYEKARNTEVSDVEIYRASMMSQMDAGPGYWKQRYKAQILEKLGNIYIRQEQWQNAESCFKEIVEQEDNRNKENAQKKLAQIWEQIGKENTFIINTEKKLIEEPQNVEVRTDYARTLLNSNKTDEAVKQYEKAVELSPEDISLRLKFADALTEDKQNDKAIDEYKTALFIAAKKNPNDFIRGKGGDNTEPRVILNRLSRFCEKAGQKDKLLDIAIDVLVMLNSPDTKWKPEEYVIERILRDMTEIYEAKGQYSAIIELWLGYHKETLHFSRYIIHDQLQYVENLKPYIDRLQKEISEDASDYWGKFILADMLNAQNDKDNAMEIYKGLLKDAAADGRLQHDLIYEFQHMRHYDLMLEASMNALAQYGQGGRDYGRALGNIAEIYLKLDDKEKAAEFYRNAMACDVSQEEHEQFNKALSKITGEKEEPERTESIAITPLVDLDALRLKAERMLGIERNYNDAEKLYIEILEKAPTDLESMVRLGEVYERSGRIKEATSLFEKAVFDEDMRVWANTPDSYYGATTGLERIYRQNNDIKKVIGLFALTGSGNFEDIKRNCKNDRELQQFHEYLMEQSQQTPNNQKLNLYLVNYFAGRGEKAKAEEIAEKLYKELSDEQGNVTDRNNAIELAKSYESLGRFEKALSVLSYFDYKSDTDTSFDRLGEILMRLYSKVNQFDKALEICGLRLEKDPRGYKTKEIAEEIAEQIAEYSLLSADGPQLLKGFLDKIKDEIPGSNYRRFRGASLSYIESHPELSQNVSAISSGTDLLALLKQGRIVEVPQNCKSFTEFLEKLASQADTLATQSFMSGIGKDMKSPRINIPSASAFEILAMVLDGTAIPLEITQEGYWAFFEAGNMNRKIHYAGSGGMICTFEGFNRKDDRTNLWALGRVFFEPAIRNNIASIQSSFTVLEAKDQRNRDISIPSIDESSWNDSGQIEILLEKNSSIDTISKLRVKTAVAFGTQWVNMTIGRLDFGEKVIHEEAGLRIEVEPLVQVADGSSMYKIPVNMENKNNINTKKIMNLKQDVYLITSDNEKMFIGYNGGFRNQKQSKINLEIDTSICDPKTTKLVIRLPAAIEIVPFELTFNNVPVIQRK